jgi:trans-2,3-dihydro-3-hydroxyanthranilate isomerase
MLATNWLFSDAHSLTGEQMQANCARNQLCESIFITKLNVDNNAATIRIFTLSMKQFAGHPIIGTSWVLMNKILSNQERLNIGPL